MQVKRKGEGLMDLLKRVLTGEQPEGCGHCLICGNKGTDNVCVCCSAIVDARRVFQLYFVDYL